MNLKQVYFFWAKPVKYRPEQELNNPIGTKDINTRHITIMYKRKRYQAAHLAWLYMTGAWPEYCIRTKNRIVWDLRFDNLELNKKRPIQNNRNFKKVLNYSNALNMIGVAR